MKVIGVVHAGQTVTVLPDELLDVILGFVTSTHISRNAQRDLWACTLVSRDWYACAIKYLYRQPILSARNFQEFDRTLSPPIASRSRRVGLEDFVHYLDMGMLAYESKKSTTSRLLSRTKNSLRSFTAPAVSFSTTGLAPLSKCIKLESLDLSRDSYDFSLLQLVRTISSLPCLTWLSLPRECLSCVSDNPYSVMKVNGKKCWPISLKYLQVNNSWIRTEGNSWNVLLSTLPPDLDTLAFRGVVNYDPFNAIGLADISLPQVTTLNINVRQCAYTYYLNHLTQPFPNVSKLSVPGMTAWMLGNSPFPSNAHTWSLSSAEFPASPKPPQNLETLVLEESPDYPTSDHITNAYIKEIIESCPKLLRIEIPEAYLSLDDDGDDEEEELDELNHRLSKRYEQKRVESELHISEDQVGIFMTEAPKTSSVGLKRSLTYRGHD